MANTQAAHDKWNTIDKAMQEKLLSTVFCVKCGVTTIVEYKIDSEKDDIIIKGKCKKCGHKVVRLVENEWL
jgi:transcription elongation factor Elf1